MKYKFTFLYCLIVLVLSVLPSSDFPKVRITNIDKLVHFCFYFGMVMVMFFDNFLSGKKYISGKKLLYFFIFAVIFGVMIEFIQYFLPTRSAELYDVLANSCGAIFGIATIFVINKFCWK